MSRRVRYGALLGLVSFGFLAEAALLGAAPATLPLVLVLVWAAIATQAVAAAYITAEPRLFGKTRDGRLPPLRAFALLPYLVGAWAIRDLLVLSRSREAPWHEVGPGIFLGRYVKRATDLPPGITCVVDLTCEMARIPGLAPDVEYIAAPALDGTVPAPAELSALVARLADTPGALYVHCAAGHGRSAVVCAALLVARGHAKDADEAARQLRAVRPLVSMNADQLGALALVCSAAEPR